jgi:hypothetical protein
MRYMACYVRVAELIDAQLVTSCGSAPGRARSKALNRKKKMVGTRRLELLTSTVSSMRSAAYNPLSVLLFRIETAEKGPKSGLVLVTRW